METKIIKAVKFELFKDGNYNSYFNNVPLNIVEDGYFDDNGDLPSGTSILIPAYDIRECFDLSDFEIVDAKIYEDIEKVENGDYAEFLDGIIEKYENYIFYTSVGRCIVEVTINKDLKVYELSEMLQEIGRAHV